MKKITIPSHTPLTTAEFNSFLLQNELNHSLDSLIAFFEQNGIGVYVMAMVSKRRDAFVGVVSKDMVHVIGYDVEYETDEDGTITYTVKTVDLSYGDRYEVGLYGGISDDIPLNPIKDKSQLEVWQLVINLASELLNETLEYYQNH